MKRFLRLLLITLAVIALPSTLLANDVTELTWYGQSAFRIVTPKGRVLLIDPWINNPMNKNGQQNLSELKRVDLILLTHGHGDHIGDSIAIAKKTGAKLVANYDLGRVMVQYAGFPAKNTDRSHMGFFGGELNLLDGEVAIQIVPALHGSTVEGATGSPLPGKVVYGGPATGFVIAVKNGPTFYHTGDTDLFSDMSLIGSLNKIDVMLACIGGHFTMGARRAALATQLVNPGTVVPMHYGANPLIRETPQQFADALNKLAWKGKQPSLLQMTIGQPVSMDRSAGQIK